MSRKVVIVGGGAGGPSSAAEAKRRDPSLDITIVEKGEFISYAA
ncbi:MAG: FAD-binding protein [Deltaproteobacteria bacterium]|nr:FAD-binding protein [Deltaproteobacteria bacterium]